MKTKLFTSLIFAIFAIVFLTGAVSAATLAEWPLTSGNTATNVASNVNAGSLTVGSGIAGLTFDATNGATGTGWNEGAVGTVDYYQVTLTAASGYNVTINEINFSQISSDATSNMNFNVDWSKDNFVTSANIVSGGVSTTTSALSANTPSTIKLTSGQTLTLRISGYNSDDSSTETFSIKNLVLGGVVTSITSITSTDICEYDDGVSENAGELEVDIRDISVINNGFGDDEQWLPLDEVEIEIRVENNGDYDVDDISLEWAIADEGNLNNDFVVDFDEIDEFNLKDGDDDTFTVTFIVDESDLDMDFDEFVGNNYQLIVRATGTIDDNDSPNDGEDTCASDSADVSFEEESDFVILNDIEVQEIASCGSDLQISADVWNIGSDDQDDVIVKIYNNELGISELKEYSTIDSYESEPLNLFVEIPDDATEKTYILTFEVYDEDNDIYQNDFDDDDSRFTDTFEVSGSCGVSGQNVLVAASIESGGKAGENLVVKATITNTGDESATYSVNAATYASWANSVDTSPKTFVLDSGDSIPVTFTFDVRDDVSGTQSFDIEVLSENQLVITQPVSVQIAESGLGLGFSTVSIVVIAVLAVLILIAIVILVIRLIK